MNVLLYDVFLGPLLTNLGLYTPPDATHGRYLLAQSPVELELQATGTGVRLQMRRVFLDDDDDDAPAAGGGGAGRGEDIRLVPEELAGPRGRRWVFYRIWEKARPQDDGAADVRPRADVVILHGINEYGGKWAPHVSGLLDQGFRVIAPDLPSHGRSTGLHVYITSPEELTNAVDAVLRDVDTFSDPERKIFFVGASMGGGIGLNFCMCHPSRERIAGVFGIAPMIGIAPETIPHPFIQRLARVLRFFAGRLPLAKAVRGNISDDPRVEAEFFADPRGYHGDLRIATGLAILACVTPLAPGDPLASAKPSAAAAPRAPAPRKEDGEAGPAAFRTPVRIVHGDRDRATSHTHSERFVALAGAADKSLEIYPGCEHVLLKVGVDTEDDKMRMRVLKDLEAWLVQRANTA